MTLGFKKLVAGLAATCVALSGCSAGGGDETESPTVVSTVEETETATETTTALPPLEYEAPPVYPEGLEVDSPANAGTFVQFAIETFNYAQRFNDAEALQAISVPDCGFCNDMSDVFLSYRDQGIRRIGGEIECTVSTVDYQPETGLFYLFTDCTTLEGTTYSASGEVIETLPASALTTTWVVTMVNGPWQLVNVGTSAEEPLE